MIGIDPGATGGIAYVWRSGLALAWPLKKMTERDIWELIKRLAAIANHAVLEKVTRAGSAYATGVLLSSRSALKMAVIAAEEIPLYEVGASVWQRKMQCLTGGDKKVSKARAQELFPEGPKMTNAIADAVLIAQYGRSLCGRFDA